MLKNYSLGITILYSIVLAIVCLIEISSAVNSVGLNIPYGDKIFHFLSYLVLSILWYNSFLYHFKFSKRKALIYAVVISIVFGILIEVLQGTITTERSSDIKDVFANSMGVLLTASVITIKNKYRLN